jgi:hypothetical protein
MLISQLSDLWKAACLRRYSLQPPPVLHELAETLSKLELAVRKQLVPKTEKTFLTSGLWHLGHSTSAAAALLRTNFSNFSAH